MERLIMAVTFLAIMVVAGCGTNNPTDNNNAAVGKGQLELTLPAPASDSVTGFLIQVCGVTGTSCNWNDCPAENSIIVPLSNHNLPNDAGISTSVGHKFASHFLSLLAGNYCVRATPMMAGTGYSENFDSYIAGNSIYTEDGVHWSDGGGSGSALVNNSTSVSSPNCLHITGAPTERADLTLTDEEIINTNRIMSFNYRRSAATGNGNVAIYWRNNTTNIFTFSTGDVSGTYYSSINGLTSENVAVFAANVWYFIEIDLDFANYRARMRVDNGTWSSYVGFISNTSSLNKIQFGPEVNFDMMVDNLNLTSNSQATGVCSVAQGGPYAVVPGQTYKAELVSNCEQPDTAGLSTVVQLNNKPMIKTPNIPSQYVCAGTPLQVTFVAEDADGDVLAWTVNGSTPSQSCTITQAPNSKESTLSCPVDTSSQGTRAITIQTCDPRNECATISFDINIATCQ